MERYKDTAKTTTQLMISVVIPTFNEEESVEQLYGELVAALASTQTRYEIIFVDDGSNDGTYEILKRLCNRDERIKAIVFRRNFGKSAALSAGFRYAKGQTIISIDADLQNNPSDIPKLLAKLNEGYDLVCGWRRKRKDPLLTKRVPSKVYNYLISKLLKLEIHDSGCALRAYRRQVTEDLDLYGEMQRFIPAWVSLKGYLITEVEVKHRPREHGETKYGPLRIFGGLADLATITFIQRFGTRPGHIFNSVGIAASILGFLLLVLLTVASVVFGTATPSFPLYLAIILALGGIQCVTIGMLSEIMTRIRYHLEGKAFYSIREVIQGKK